MLSACSSSPTDEAPPEASPAGAPQPVSLDDSCALLIGDDGGLITASGNFLRDVDSLSDETAGKAQGFSDELGKVAETGVDELQAPLARMREPLDGIVEAARDGTGFNMTLKDFADAGTEVIDLCTGGTETPAATEAATGLSYELSCSIDSEGHTTFTTYKDAWSKPFDLCYAAGDATGTASAAEEAAADGYSEDPDGAQHLYGVCAVTAGHYIDGPVSSNQAEEITRALTLCPDHPKRAKLEANATAALSGQSDLDNGKFVSPGKYLVGKTAQPGTWQSEGAQVEDCYWEVSDAQGNILANNFISIAPQFTIQVPATAAGFTVEGCSFRWISD